VNGLAFDVRASLFALLGKDITQIDGLGPYLSLKLIAECGDDLSAWPSTKHFTSWLGLAPNNKISGGKTLSSRTRRCGSRAAALLRLAAVTVGRTDTALGAFYRRLSARIGKAKAVTATARKIAVLFYNAARHGMEYVDPGASFYETRYRTRVIDNLHRRAKAFGFVLQPLAPTPGVAVFLGIVFQRQLADLSVRRLHVNRRLHRSIATARAENIGGPALELRLPRRDLIGMHVELLRQLSPGVRSALMAASATFALKAGV
jgi:hypothetical protein